MREQLLIYHCCHIIAGNFQGKNFHMSVSGKYMSILRRKLYYGMLTNRINSGLPTILKTFMGGSQTTKVTKAFSLKTFPPYYGTRVIINFLIHITACMYNNIIAINTIFTYIPQCHTYEFALYTPNHAFLCSVAAVVRSIG